MAIEIKRKEPPKSVEPIEQITVGEVHLYKDLTLSFTRENTVIMCGTLACPRKTAIDTKEARQLGQALIEMADQIESKK